MPGEKEVNPSYIVPYQPVAGIDKSPSMGFTLTPGKNRDILAKVISDRVSFLKGTIDEIDFLIHERLKLKESIGSEIEQKVCDVQNVIYGLELDMCGVIDKSRRRISLEQQIGELYREDRQQKLSHWQDTGKLKHERRMAEKELQSAMLDLWMIRFLS